MESKVVFAKYLVVGVSLILWDQSFLRYETSTQQPNALAGLNHHLYYRRICSMYNGDTASILINGMPLHWPGDAWQLEAADIEEKGLQSQHRR